MKKAITTKPIHYGENHRVDHHSLVNVESTDIGLVAYRQNSNVGIQVTDLDLIFIDDANILTGEDALRNLKYLLSKIPGFESQVYELGLPENNIKGFYFLKKDKKIIAFKSSDGVLDIEEFRFENQAISWLLQLQNNRYV
jgi:hypothetical protein